MLSDGLFLLNMCGIVLSACVELKRRPALAGGASGHWALPRQQHAFRDAPSPTTTTDASSLVVSNGAFYVMM